MGAIEDFRESLSIRADSAKIEQAERDRENVRAAIARVTPLPVRPDGFQVRMAQRRAESVRALTDRLVEPDPVPAAPRSQESRDRFNALFAAKAERERVAAERRRARDAELDRAATAQAARERARVEVTARMTAEFRNSPEGAASRRRHAALMAVRESARHFWQGGDLEPVCGADVGHVSPMPGINPRDPGALGTGRCPDCLLLLH